MLYDILIGEVDEDVEVIVYLDGFGGRMQCWRWWI